MTALGSIDTLLVPVLSAGAGDGAVARGRACADATRLDGMTHAWVLASSSNPREAHKATEGWGCAESPLS